MHRMIPFANKKILAAMLAFSNFFGTAMAATLTTTTTLPSGGMTLTQEQQAYTTSQNLIDSKNTLLVLAAAAGPVTLTAAAQGLLDVLLTAYSYRIDMNLLFGTTFVSTGPQTDFDRATLNSIAAQQGYVQSVVISNMQKDLIKSGRNLPNVSIQSASSLNILGLLSAPGVVVMRDALEIIEKTYLKEKRDK